MNIIIVGAGEIGRHLATRLSRQAHAITVIESNEQLAQELEQQLDARVMFADGTSVEVLLEAGVGNCELFMAVTSENSINIMASSMAKKMGVEQTVARVHPRLQREEWLFDYRGEFGIDHLFSSERLSAIELSKFIRNPDSVHVEELARGRIELQQVRVSEKSQWVGKSLAELKFPERTRIASIQRGGDHFVPKADTALKAGDLVTIFGEPRRLADLVPSLCKARCEDEQLRVVIFGGGEYGFALAQMLESWSCKVRIFEKDTKLCQMLTDRLSDTTVINVDATVVSELEEEQIGNVDFFVATSNSDEDNVMTCLQAHNLGAAKCLTLIHRSDYADAISASGHHFGVQAAVSPREATRRELERFITDDKFHLVKKLGAGDLIETRIAKGAIVAGHKVHEVEWPQGCVLIGRLHGIHAEPPAADDLLAAGDHIYALVSSMAMKKFLRLVH